MAQSVRSGRSCRPERRWSACCWLPSLVSDFIADRHEGQQCLGCLRFGRGPATACRTVTGYYKYRQRSYFPLQTADAIEEETNACTLGLGPYSDFDLDQEQQALKLFTQRVEEHRNEQQRRQQLDQPADQIAPTGQPPTA
ncbi:hypothetical protein ACFWPU_44595 [Streptomyces sp. NPDC058471]|uniref:hypothetical protein n=1 Tax=Streptomyces sp. NPDC058471 TaxID=3346516 RepID=UPI00364ADAC0